MSNYSNYRHIPIHTSIAALEMMTPEQRRALSQLALRSDVGSIRINPQFDLPDGYLGFTLYRNGHCESAAGRDVILVGGIDQNGSVST